jgi:hypothetical protein
MFADTCSKQTITLKAKTVAAARQQIKGAKLMGLTVHKVEACGTWIDQDNDTWFCASGRIANRVTNGSTLEMYQEGGPALYGRRVYKSRLCRIKPDDADAYIRLTFSE